MNQVQYQLTLHFLATEPVAAARRLEVVNSAEAAAIVKGAPISSATNVLKSMIPSVAAKLFAFFSAEQCQSLTESMDVADLAAILRHVDSKQRSEMLALLSKRKQALCQMLINYPDYTVGSLLETDVLIADSHMHVQDVLTRLKKRRYSYLQWIYVVNQSRQLSGKIFIGDLFAADPTSEVATLIQAKCEMVSANTDLITAIEWGMWNHQDSIAVTNKRKEFIGVLFYHRIRHFMSLKQAREVSHSSFSADLLEVYGDTIVNMVDLIQPMDKTSQGRRK